MHLTAHPVTVGRIRKLSKHQTIYTLGRWNIWLSITNQIQGKKNPAQEILIFEEEKKECYRELETYPCWFLAEHISSSFLTNAQLKPSWACFDELLKDADAWRGKAIPQSCRLVQLGLILLSIAIIWERPRRTSGVLWGSCPKHALSKECWMNRGALGSVFILDLP